MKKKDIVTCILLSIITLGIYTIFWTVDLMFQTDKCFKERKTSVLLKIVYTIITGGLYAIYWVYRIGKEMAAKSKYIVDKASIYAVLIFFAIASEFNFVIHVHNTSYIYIGIGFIYELIVMCLIQNDLNLLIDKKAIK